MKAEVNITGFVFLEMLCRAIISIGIVAIYGRMIGYYSPYMVLPAALMAIWSVIPSIKTRIVQNRDGKPSA